MKSGLKELYLLLLVCYIFAFVSCATPVAEVPPRQAPPATVESSFAVRPVKAKWLVLKHPYYTIDYDASLRIPRKVTYTLTAERLQKKMAKRKLTKFHEDPLLLERGVASVKVTEYRAEKGTRAAYDRGHMAPANDFAFSQEAMNDTFVMSNMVPQTPGLNEVAWKTLEVQVQRWACGEKKLTVITGPIIDEAKPKTLSRGLVVPEKFYKILVDETPPRKAIGFVYAQTDDQPKIHSRRIAAVAEIARESRLDFDEELRDLAPSSLETKGRLGEWAEARCGR